MYMAYSVKLCGVTLFFMFLSVYVMCFESPKKHYTSGDYFFSHCDVLLQKPYVSITIIIHTFEQRFLFQMRNLLSFREVTFREI